MNLPKIVLHLDNFYSGKQVTALSKSLTPADNITGSYLANNYYFNRPPTETLSLPYDFKDIKCEPSEYINQNSLKKCYHLKREMI